MFPDAGQGRIVEGSGGISSNPTTEQSCGTLTPALMSARIAPKAVISSKATNAVKRSLRASNSFVHSYPPS